MVGWNGVSGENAQELVAVAYATGREIVRTYVQ